MAYLVRRLLENTSNESFLRRGFASTNRPRRCWADPEAYPHRAAARVAHDSRTSRTPTSPRAAVRDDSPAALAGGAPRLGGDYPW